MGDLGEHIRRARGNECQIGSSPYRNVIGTQIVRIGKRINITFAMRHRFECRRRRQPQPIRRRHYIDQCPSLRQLTRQTYRLKRRYTPSHAEQYVLPFEFLHFNIPLFSLLSSFFSLLSSFCFQISTLSFPISTSRFLLPLAQSITPAAAGVHSPSPNLSHLPQADVHSPFPFMERGWPTGQG